MKPAPLSPSTQTPPYYPHLDGIRGLAALYVLVFHTVVSSPFVLAQWAKPFRLGHHAVAVFIVVSGFSLMLPVVSGTRRPMSTIYECLDFMKRRARRIFPPYYAAYALSLIVYFFIRVALHLPMSDTQEGITGSPFDPGNLIAHALLLHNLLQQWFVISANGAHWSIAVEWQIYLLFPTVLLPIWRRWGILVLVLMSLLLGGVLFHFLPAYHLVSPWFVGVFALGMVGAVVAFAPDKPGREAAILRSLRDKWCSMLANLAVIFFFVAYWLGDTGGLGTIDAPQWWILDFVMGTGVIALLVLLCRPDLSSGLVGLRSVLGAKPLVFLGAFSYSLYLTHFPVLYMVDFLFPRPASPFAIMGTQFVAALLFGYGFFLVFEKPFTTRRPKPALDNQSTYAV